MRIQEYAADCALSAAEEAFRYARAVPAEKLDWSPEGVGQTVMSMCRELAMTPSWAAFVFTPDEFKFDAETHASQKAEMETWTTVDDCENQFKQRMETLRDVYLGLSDEDLKKTKWLPFNGGRDHTFLELLDYPRWNCTYHLGQIAYIQILFGDKEMH